MYVYARIRKGFELERGNHLFFTLGVLNLTDLSANSKSRTMSLSNLEEICARATPDLLNQLLGNIKLMQVYDNSWTPKGGTLA